MVNLQVLSKLLGHQELSTTELYFDLSENQIKHEYKKIAI